MNQEHQDIFDELLRTTQVIRKNAMGNEGRYVLDGAFQEAYDRAATDEDIERILTKLFPWLFGPSSIMHILTRPRPTGMDLYNALVIAHQLDRTGIIRMAWNVYSRFSDLGDLPEPNPRMCLDE